MKKTEALDMLSDIDLYVRDYDHYKSGPPFHSHWVHFHHHYDHHGLLYEHMDELLAIVEKYVGKFEED